MMQCRGRVLRLNELVLIFYFVYLSQQTKASEDPLKQILNILSIFRFWKKPENKNYRFIKVENDNCKLVIYG